MIEEFNASLGHTLMKSKYSYLENISLLDKKLFFLLVKTSYLWRIDYQNRILYKYRILVSFFFSFITDNLQIFTN